MALSNRPLRLFTVILLAVFSIFAVHVHSQAAQRETAHAAIITVTSETSKPALEDFSWLAGRWEGKLGPMTAEQQWMAPRNGTMQGFFRLTDSEKTIVIEPFTIREMPGGIEFYFPPFFSGVKTLGRKRSLSSESHEMGKRHFPF